MVSAIGIFRQVAPVRFGMTWKDEQAGAVGEVLQEALFEQLHRLHDTVWSLSSNYDLSKGTDFDYFIQHAQYTAAFNPSLFAENLHYSVLIGHVASDRAIKHFAESSWFESLSDEDRHVVSQYIESQVLYKSIHRRNRLNTPFSTLVGTAMSLGIATLMATTKLLSNSTLNAIRYMRVQPYSPFPKIVAGVLQEAIAEFEVRSAVEYVTLVPVRESWLKFKTRQILQRKPLALPAASQETKQLPAGPAIEGGVSPDSGRLTIEVPASRAHRYLEKPIEFEVHDLPVDAPSMQIDYLTVDLTDRLDSADHASGKKRRRGKRKRREPYPIAIYELNGYSSGLYGYERYYPEVNLVNVAFDLIAQQGHKMYWIDPPKWFLRENSWVSQSVLESSARVCRRDEWLAAGAERISYEEFGRLVKRLREQGNQETIIAHCLKGFGPPRDESIVYLNGETTPVMEDKVLMQIIFAERVPDLVPRTILLRKKRNLGESLGRIAQMTRDKPLTQEEVEEIKKRYPLETATKWIKEYLNAPLVVFKPPREAQGRGIVFKRPDELLWALSVYWPEEHIPPEYLGEGQAGLLSAGAALLQNLDILAHGTGIHNEKMGSVLGRPLVLHKGDKTVLLQEFVQGTPVTSPVTGHRYDPTTRLVYVLIRSGKTVRFYPLDAYEKLPKPLSSGLQGMGVSNIHEGEGSLPVMSEEKYKAIVRDMTRFYQRTYGSFNMQYANALDLLKRY